MVWYVYIDKINFSIYIVLNSFIFPIQEEESKKEVKYMIKRIFSFFKKKPDIWEVYIKFDKYTEATYIFESEWDALNFYHRYDYILNHTFLIQERAFMKNGEPVNIFPWPYKFWIKRIMQRDYNESIERFKIKDVRK